ncbi:hypothetical protein OIU78_008015 [Salix suchowensis]|nr:hypothetical protein OIU78_008015 [Salix suchowensis]
MHGKMQFKGPGVLSWPFVVGSSFFGLQASPRPGFVVGGWAAEALVSFPVAFSSLSPGLLTGWADVLGCWPVALAVFHPCLPGLPQWAAWLWTMGCSHGLFGVPGFLQAGRLSFRLVVSCGVGSRFSASVWFSPFFWAVFVRVWG